MIVPVAFDRDLYEQSGVIRKVTIDLAIRAMILIIGATGMGKTFCTRYLIATMAKLMPEMRLTIIDIKMFDFYSDFSDCPRCFGADDSLIGIKRFFDEFEERKRLGRAAANLPLRVLLIDEYADLAAMAAFEKKANKNAESDSPITVKEAMTLVARLLMTGRAYSQTLIIGCQRAQSDLFQGGSRDNFGNILHLGNFSKEQKIMLASEYADEITNDCGRGQGYLIQTGKPISRIVIPTYDVERANTLIRGVLQD